MKRLAQTAFLLIVLPGFALGGALHGFASSTQQVLTTMLDVWKKDKKGV